MHDIFLHQMRSCSAGSTGVPSPVRRLRLLLQVKGLKFNLRLDPSYTSLVTGCSLGGPISAKQPSAEKVLATGLGFRAFHVKTGGRRIWLQAARLERRLSVRNVSTCNEK